MTLYYHPASKTSRGRPNWPKVHEAFYKYLVDPAKDQRFEVV